MRRVTGKHLSNQIQYVGKKFNYLTVLEYIGHNHNKHAVFKFECDCGKCIQTTIGDVRNGSPSSCGCRSGKYLNKDRKLYLVWYQMIKRCTKKSNKDFVYYGGRGVSVCSEWHNFDTFSQWAIESGYKQGLTIDRIKNSGNYTPNNCRWVTMDIQAANKRYSNRGKTIVVDGVEKTYKEWAELLGGSASLIYDRVHRQGWDPRDAVTKKPKSVRKVVRK
ncbi:hypothetical protein NO989_04595 [Alteromonas sp. DY56-G5]|jgi:hypothetical protein|uniref:hypothetical protein n=1 Tax=Alteromonas sp. DY56-G5 TaxID=2967128 RepID=UPI00352BB643